MLIDWKNPPAEYRTVPFWSWNDKLEVEELERQIEEMHRVGIGGFFMHARGGLETPYMGEEWMSAVRACIVKAKELGMEAWLYDENGWPSGFSGGLVPAKGLAYQQKRLAYERAPFQEGTERTIAYYVHASDGHYRVTASAQDAELRVFYEVNPYYSDTLSMEAVRAFIETSYEAYWRRFGDPFGGDIRGVFTDEPQFARGGLPWSFELERVFAARYGYPVLEALPSLFFDTQGCKKHRYDYWDCVTHMFTRAFSKQIGDWCGEHGWLATGHVVDEQELMNQVTSVGDPMAFYEFQHIPGCDWLGRFTGEEPVVPKQVSSVARQLGRKRTITESYGCSGWNISMGDLKRIGEWQFVHGMNMMCQHLQGYTLRGLRKRDYPPSLFFQQPYWDEYKAYNDYFGRLSMLLAEGTRQAGVLLLHPVRTAWLRQCGKDSSGTVPYHKAFAELSRWMCRSFLEHDYGSESIIEGHGTVRDNALLVGAASYRAVVVPPCETLSRTAVDLLLRFGRGGGRVAMYGPFPTLINGEPDDGRLEELLRLAVKPTWNPDALLSAVAGAVLPFVRILKADGTPLASDHVNVQTLEWNGSSLYYIVNSGPEDYGRVTVELSRGERRLSLMDPETGDIRPIGCGPGGDGLVRVELPLLPGQSHMLKGEAPDAGELTAPDVSDPFPHEEAPLAAEYRLQPDWELVHTEWNSLTLDTCRYREEEGDWSEPQPVVLLQEKLLALGRPVQLEQEFEFRLDLDPGAARELYLVMERPDTVKITLNGRPVTSADCGWWRDTSFRKVNIAGLAIKGRNSIRVRSYFYNSPETYRALDHARKFESVGNKLTVDSELESLYIAGDFGVRSEGAYAEGERGAVYTDGPFVLTERPETVDAGDLVRQGFPFYAGKLRLRQRLKIDTTRWSAATWSFGLPPDAITARLLVNGEEVKTFLWEPYAADITAFLRPGENTIELELANSCRNLLGPHHHVKGELHKLGPDSFKDKPGWTDRDLPPETNIYVERYAFVRFGLSEAPRVELR